MKISPTHSRSSLRTLGLLTVAAAFTAGAAELTVVPTNDKKVVRRWSISGGPRGVAIGPNGIAYVGLADKQAVVAIDTKSGAIVKEVVLDSAEIAATKELVTLRMNPKRTRLFIANGSDESATILSIPNLGVVREITMEGETIRDVVPDPKGRWIYVLGRRVHVFDGEGEDEVRTLDMDQPMAIATTSDGRTLAVLGTEDFGNTKATVVALYETTTFKEIARDPLQTDKSVDAAMFAAGDSALIALSREYLFEKPLTTRAPKTMQSSSSSNGSSTMRMSIDFGDIVSSDRICLPEGSGPQIAVLGATPDQLIFAERRCSSSGTFSGSSRKVSPASLYGVNAYALAYDAASNMLIATDKAGFVTIYRVAKR